VDAIAENLLRKILEEDNGGLFLLVRLLEIIFFSYIKEVQVEEIFPSS
jgi:hypothetical protein